MLKSLNCFIALPAITVLPITLFSCANSTVLITLDPDGGKLNETTISVSKSTRFSQIHLPEPTKENYRFIKWTFLDGGDIDQDYIFHNNITLKAYYETNIEEVQITLDPNGGSLGKSKYKLPRGAIYEEKLFNKPFKRFYDFNKWTIDGKEIPLGYKFENNVTLKASYVDGWEKRYIKDLNIKKPIEGFDYLYEVTINDYDDTAADPYLYNFYSQPKNKLSAFCTIFKQGNFIGRNMDWELTFNPEFIIHTPSNPDKNRYATVGMAYANELTANQVGKPEAILGHQHLPFLTTDGINEKGFFAAMNELPIEDLGNNPGDGSVGKPAMFNLRAVRYLLDHASCVDDVMELLNKFNIYGSAVAGELHLFVADISGKCGVVEFEWTDEWQTAKRPKLYLSNESRFKEICTNFTFTDYKGDCKNWASETSSLTPHSKGCERYNIIDEKLSNTQFKSLDEILEFLKEMYYSWSYRIPLEDNSPNFRFSEFNWPGTDKTTPHTVEEYGEKVNKAKAGYKEYKRGESGSGWTITRHSAAYDIKNMQLKLILEEEHKLDKTITIEREN